MAIGNQQAISNTSEYVRTGFSQDVYEAPVPVSDEGFCYLLFAANCQLLFAGLSRRPTHLASTQQVQMQVKHALAGIGTNVVNRAEAVL